MDSADETRVAGAAASSASAGAGGACENPAPVLDATRDLPYPDLVRQKFADPVPDEVPGDVFDRQRTIVHWDQSVVEKQVVFVLGTGGLGQSVAMAMCRLGVAKMFLLDREAYDASNLTRQVLGGLADVGKRKVDVAVENLRVHNLRTELVPMDMDAVVHWDKVVEAAKECTVVFNCIDFGTMFDHAVNGLCKELQIPYVSGSSYGMSAQVEYFSGRPEDKCWSCTTGVSQAFQCGGGASFQTHAREQLLAWAQATMECADPPPTIPAVVLKAYLASELHMVLPEGCTWVEDTLAALDCPGGLDPTKSNQFFQGVCDAVLLELLPGRVSKLSTISFVPREAHFPTRNVGSWVGVCVGAAMLMANAFIQHLQVQAGQDAMFPNTADLTFTSMESLTDRAMGGVPTSDDDCKVCAAAKALYATPGEPE